MMKCNDLICRLVQYGADKEVFVTVFTRDENGAVTSKISYPVEAAFSHLDQCHIYVEQSNAQDEFKGVSNDSH